MIYLLYGPDTYRSRQKLKEIIGGYRQKAGGNLNFHRIDMESGHPAQLKNIFDTDSLFSAKKLILIENAFSYDSGLEDITYAAKSAGDSSNTILVLWDRELSAAGKKRAQEVLKHTAKAYEFKPLTGAFLRSWILEEARKRGLQLSLQELSELELRGGDLWGLVNLLEKMMVTGPAPALIRNPSESSIFHLGDTFFVSPKPALRHLLGLIQRGEDEFNMFSYLAGHARNILTIHHFFERRKSVPANQGIHPFVVKKITSLAPHISLDKIQKFVSGFFEEDHKIKTGLSRPKDSLINILLNVQEK